MVTRSRRCVCGWAHASEAHLVGEIAYAIVQRVFATAGRSLPPIHELRRAALRARESTRAARAALMSSASTKGVRGDR